MLPFAELGAGAIKRVVEKHLKNSEKWKRKGDRGGGEASA